MSQYLPFWKASGQYEILSDAIQQSIFTFLLYEKGQQKVMHL
ncbi:Uncharacterised protein [Klebsiella pneumoniae]|nr:Uncharacterised protein [Klebsiella pneumoniae]